MSNGMQPFSGIESSEENFGGRRADAGGAGDENSGAEYRALPFTDLVEEDKHGFVRRRWVSTLFGGYRTVLSEEHAEGSVPVSFHLAQILIYLIVPSTTLVSVSIYTKKEERMQAALAVGGLLPLLVYLLLRIPSEIFASQVGPGDDESVDLENFSCFSKDGFAWLFPPRQDRGEVLLGAIFTYAFGAGMSYVLHPRTVQGWTGTAAATASLTADQVPLLIIIGLSSYSLYSHHCPEIAVYGDNDQEFEWGSNHYQRACYCIALAGVLLGCELANVCPSEVVVTWVYRSFYIVYFLQVFGLLAHPVVTLLWAVEQVNVHLLGGTARASDSRIVLSFLLSAAFLAVPLYLEAEGKDPKHIRISIVLLAYMSSHNLLCSVGLRKPFKAVNERLQAQKTYADIVFSGTRVAAKNRGSGFQGGEVLQASLWSTLTAIGLAVVALLVAYEPSAPRGSGPEMKALHSDATVALVIALVVTLLQMIRSYSTRHTVLRVIPCLHLRGGAAWRVGLLNGLYRLLAIVCLSTVYLKAFEVGGASKKWGVARAFEMVLIFRAHTRAHHDPLGASFESLVLLKFQSPAAVALTAFALHRARLLLNKVVYMLASVLTALKNKKQRFEAQGLCFLLQYTLLLPVTLSVLLITTLLDTALVPYLGFAFFIVGYPKPQRGWSSINPVSANPSDARSDGHLYQALLPELSQHVRGAVGEDPFSFGRDQFYLLKNEKMIILLQVLERGTNYLMFTVKGTELQETTVCHAEENGRMNDVCEALFEKQRRQLNFLFSLAPIRQMDFGVYDDQKVSLAGIIENPAFGALVQKAYIQVILLKLKDNFAGRANASLYKIHKSELAGREMQAGKSLLARGWLGHLGFDHRPIQYQPIPVSHGPAAGKNFKNQVQPASALRLSAVSQSPSKPLTFLDRLEADNRAADAQAQRTPVRASSHLLGQAQVQRGGAAGHDEGARHAGGAKQGGNEEGAVAPPVSRSVVPGAIRPPRQGNTSGRRPLDDLDDLEDMLEDLEGGGRDDLDDLLEDLEGLGGGDDKGRVPTNVSKPTPQRTLPWKAPTHYDEVSSSEGMTRGPNPSASSGGEVMAGLPSEGLHHYEKKDGSARAQSSRLQSRGKLQGYRPTASRGGGEDSDIEKFAFESFHLLFGDEYQSMPVTLLSIFKGTLRKNSDNRAFLESTDPGALRLNYAILQAARLAFHWALESFIMGELDLPDHYDFESEIRKTDQEWFFGSEEYLWNSAIERNLPNLERLIQKKDGQYFAHRLKFGQSKESVFSVFQFRREVIRGIWANLNMELLYYTNANDERFSIQAEKDILRNLLVQLAEIPLGYPVFSSGAQSAVY